MWARRSVSYSTLTLGMAAPIKKTDWTVSYITRKVCGFQERKRGSFDKLRMNGGRPALTPTLSQGERDRRRTGDGGRILRFTQDDFASPVRPRSGRGSFVPQDDYGKKLLHW